MLGAGRQALDGQIGWPGISFGYLAGVNDRFDVGGHAMFAYGFEGDPRIVQPGVKLGADLKLKLASGDKAVILLDFMPGFSAYFGYPGFNDGTATVFLVNLPVAFRVGLRLTPPLLLHMGVVFPLAFGVVSAQGVGFGFFQFPIQPEIGVEYALDARISVTFALGFGPYVAALNGTSFTDPTFRAMFGMTYRL
jgi:hypothetical protein